MDEDIIHKKEFYIQLAHLFYAVAMADGKMVKDEKLRIMQLVEKYWLYKSTSWDSKEIIYNTLKRLNGTWYDKAKAFEDFKTYYQNHKSLFNAAIKKKIIISGSSIASAFNATNKSELILVTKLRNLLID